MCFHHTILNFFGGNCFFFLTDKRNSKYFFKKRKNNFFYFFRPSICIYIHCNYFCQKFWTSYSREFIINFLLVWNSVGRCSTLGSCRHRWQRSRILVLQKAQLGFSGLVVDEIVIVFRRNIKRIAFLSCKRCGVNHDSYFSF